MTAVQLSQILMKIKEKAIWLDTEKNHTKKNSWIKDYIMIKTRNYIKVKQ